MWIHEGRRLLSIFLRSRPRAGARTSASYEDSNNCITSARPRRQRGYSPWSCTAKGVRFTRSRRRGRASPPATGETKGRPLPSTTGLRGATEPALPSACHSPGGAPSLIIEEVLDPRQEASMAEKITKRADDYSQWYLDVVKNAGL